MQPFDSAAGDLILTAVRGGSTLETALDYAGVSRAAFEGWLEAAIEENDRVERGNTPRPAYEPVRAFYKAYNKARVEPIVRNVARVQQAANDGSWQAAAWWLERAAPDLYGRPTKNFTPVDRPDLPKMD